ncbi:uncharacterized protein LOC132702459 [Cylas formicarius]|uniref:uncharacterized protein LOC132702459 n=1 Tax=Cylas formicarius TaxID=197179 RepID=UPI002958B32B|nr:uncharacterized protein LOC132702459 [Cylas formicarius]
MIDLRDLGRVSQGELRNFVRSFDHVMCDVDGVLVLGNSLIPGANKCISALRKLGKRVSFITNNGTATTEQMLKNLSAFGAKEDEIISPVTSIIAYLKKINFNRDLYVIGGSNLRDSLKRAGFNLVDFQPDQLGHSEDLLAELKTECVKVKNATHNIGAVLVDTDFKLTLLKVQRAVVLLTSRDDILLISGGPEDCIPSGKDFKVIGPKFYIDAIERLSQKKCTVLAKPSVHLQDTLEDQFKIRDPKRILFIGDSVGTDMAFASQCGFQKLLVLTGVTREGDLENWTYPVEYKPHYYVKSLNALNEELIDF